jgi:hypothetical protein
MAPHCSPTPPHTHRRGQQRRPRLLRRLQLLAAPLALVTATTRATRQQQQVTMTMTIAMTRKHWQQR